MEAQMKAKDVMSGVLTVILWIAVSGLCAQQPQIEISLANSLGIQHAYDDVIKLESGDLQFYKMTAGNGSIEITGFQYLRQSNTLTNVVQIGSITGIEEQLIRRSAHSVLGNTSSSINTRDTTPKDW